MIAKATKRRTKQHDTKLTQTPMVNEVAKLIPAGLPIVAARDTVRSRDMEQTKPRIVMLNPTEGFVALITNEATGEEEFDSLICAGEGSWDATGNTSYFLDIDCYECYEIAAVILTGRKVRKT